MHDAWFLPSAPGLIDQVAAQPVQVTPGLVRIGLKPLPDLARAKGLDGVVVLRDVAGNESMLSVSAPRAAPRAGSSGFAISDLPRLLLLALLGGIVLNLMPCVFPVLAMKALAFSRIAGSHHAEQRASVAFYTGGVLVAFAALGALMLGLRAAGSAGRLGLPVPVAAVRRRHLLAAVRRRPEPRAAYTRSAAALRGWGRGWPSRRGHAGDFATGLLAVLVATPCTAPFMGVAIVGALAAPARGRHGGVPDHGAWPCPALRGVCPGARAGEAAAATRHLGWWCCGKALSFPIFASCVWLAWVLSIEAGDRGVLLLGAGLVLLALAGWLLGLSQRAVTASAPRRGRWCMAASALSLLATLALLP